MSATLDDVQRLVLLGRRDAERRWTHAVHLMLHLNDQPVAAPLRFLNRLLEDGIDGATGACPALQCSLGFTRRGLERCHVPRHVLAAMAMKAPAFWAGAALRATRNLGLSGESAPEHWSPAFATDGLAAVLSLHTVVRNGSADRVTDIRALTAKVRELRALAQENGFTCRRLPVAALLPDPSGQPRDPRAPGQWVHFDYLDGLSRIAIEGWSDQKQLNQCLPGGRHAAGEFILGHVRNHGGNPWVAGPGRHVWPDELRAFFRNGSFGVLHQIRQDVGAFESWIHQHANGRDAARLKGLLCGRTPDGLPLAPGPPGQNAPGPDADFDYALDPTGAECPFHSHTRRMNPRLDYRQPPSRPDPGRLRPLDESLAHASQPRPLLRRGMPYGRRWTGSDQRPRGLMGQFFCASLEDQYEHLLGEWAERMPLGSTGDDRARDPFIGHHARGDGSFGTPRLGSPPERLSFSRPFTSTVGAAYLFYPSLTALRGIADSALWMADDWGETR